MSSTHVSHAKVCFQCAFRLLFNRRMLSATISDPARCRYVRAWGAHCQWRLGPRLRGPLILGTSALTPQPLLAVAQRVCAVATTPIRDNRYDGPTTQGSHRPCSWHWSWRARAIQPAIVQSQSRSDVRISRMVLWHRSRLFCCKRVGDSELGVQLCTCHLLLVNVSRA